MFSPHARADLLLALPLLWPLATAALSLLAWRHPRRQRALALIGAVGLLCSAVVLLRAVQERGILSAQAGGWPAPFGITLAADLFSAMLLVVASIAGLAVLLYAFATFDISAQDRKREGFGFYPLFLFLLLGVTGAFLTGDLFNLYVWFEVLLLSSFVLLALGGEKRQMEGAIRYFVLNMLSSTFFLAALGLLYGSVGTLNLADLALRLSSMSEPERLTPIALLFLLAFGLKAAIFPLYFWLPASYPTPPPVISALFAGLLTKVGVYAIVRIFATLFVEDLGLTHLLLLWLAGLTMVFGVLGAVAQNEVRQILSFHIVSQIGYMLLGLALLTPLALAGSIFYIVHHIVVKTNLFLIAGLIYRLRTTGRLAQLGGLLHSRPGVAVLFAISALSLAGLPPFSGFWAKLVLIQASLRAEQYVIAACALGVGLLTLLSMTKIWSEVYWGVDTRVEQELSGTGSRPPMPVLGALLLPVLLLTAVSLGIAVFAGPLLELSQEAGAQLLDRDAYIRAVLGDAALEAALPGAPLPGDPALGGSLGEVP